MTTSCPCCGSEIRSVGVGYCLDCGVYTDWTEPGSGVGSEVVQASARRDDPRLEKQIQLAIKRVLALYPVQVWDTSQPHAAAITPGLPDLYVVGFGTGLWVEVKRADGDLTAAQEMFRDACREHGVPWACWRHEDDALAWVHLMMREAA